MRCRSAMAAAGSAVLGLGLALGCAPSHAESAHVSEAASVQASESVASRQDTLALYVEAHLPRYRATGRGKVTDRLERVALMRSLGLRGTRLDFEWNDVEPTRGWFDWSVHDSIVAELRSAGLDAFGMLAFSPTWARPTGTAPPHRPVVDGSAALGDTLFAAFAARAARRYAGSIDRWEVWNEPNLASFWSRGRNPARFPPDPADYLRLFRLVRDSILEANPRARVATAGLASGTWRQGPLGLHRSASPDIPAPAFLRGMLRHGLDSHLVGLHPYTRRPLWELGTRDAPTNPLVDSALAILHAAGHNGTELWITEWGVDASLAATDSVAREWFASGLRVLLCQPAVDLVSIYALSDWRSERRFGLVDDTGARTPIGDGLTMVLSSPLRCP